MNDEEQLLRYI